MAAFAGDFFASAGFFFMAFFVVRDADLAFVLCGRGFMPG